MVGRNNYHRLPVPFANLTPQSQGLGLATLTKTLLTPAGLLLDLCITAASRNNRNHVLL
ncbi:hypothetical protein [Synechococcus sp. M16CYN]|uniref:hypothetical protein n=1 Tax=Synechococcus sp. M16CYN TaxID=3103139 RepID=UPI0033406CB1